MEMRDRFTEMREMDLQVQSKYYDGPFWTVLVLNQFFF